MDDDVFERVKQGMRRIWELKRGEGIAIRVCLLLRYSAKPLYRPLVTELAKSFQYTR